MGLNEIEYKVALIANPYKDYTNIKENIDAKNLPSGFISSNKLSLLLNKQGVPTDKSKKDERKYNHLLDELVRLAYELKMSEVKFVFIKFRKLPHPCGDLDILVVDGLTNAEAVLYTMDHIPDEKDSDPYRRKYVKTEGDLTWGVDLHLEAAWVGVMYLDKKRIWDARSRKEIKGVDIPVPSDGYDLLITAAHDMKSNAITLFDILHIYPLLKEKDIDIEFLRNEAKANGWEHQFNAFINKVLEIYLDLYESSKPSKTQDLPFYFPVHISTLYKMQKALLDLKRLGLKRGSKKITSYLVDLKECLRGFK